MSDIIKQDAVFGSYYNRINSLILKTKQNVIKNINYEMDQAAEEFSKLFKISDYSKDK